jgi:hypothetical protein
VSNGLPAVLGSECRFTQVTLRAKAKAKAAAIKKPFAKLMVNADGVVCDGLCAEVSV